MGPFLCWSLGLCVWAFGAPLLGIALIVLGVFLYFCTAPPNDMRPDL